MKRRILRSLIVVLVLALTCIYALPGILSTSDNASHVDNNVNASFNFNEEEVLEQLKAQNINAINKDLLQKIDDYRLTGAVNVIITLSEGSVVGQYNQLGNGTKLREYLLGNDAQTTAKRAIARQDKLEAQLLKEGLITSAKYHYSTILDGFSAETTYENLGKLMSHEGVYRVIIGNTYLPQATNAVENKVNVYDTGIFKSDEVADKYTGQHNIVAVLDTGCDYRHPAFTTRQVVRPRYDSSDIARLLPGTVAYQNSTTQLEARDVYYGNITNDKIAFGYDYADNDPDVMPLGQEHGTHVAGIIGGYANDSIFEQNDKFDGAADSVLRGVAIDTQFAIMKVFGDYEQGAKDEDILAALEDCVKLDVDAINMSLGTSCGFTREEDESYKSDIYDRIEEAGISLIVAASNDYSSGMGGEESNTNKVENPDSGTVGAPSTYVGALSVASINGNKDKYMVTDTGRVVFFDEAASTAMETYDFFKALDIRAGEDKTFEYVTVPGDGAPGNYVGLNVTGKIVLVQRGNTSFEDKAMTAQNRGAAGIIVYNNVYGDITMTVGNNIRDNFAVCSIGKEDGDVLASKGSGTLTFNGSNQAGPFMSDFSSWGPNPDLTLKPEITAHGGNIWSAIPGGGYEKLSGTSMASPNMCGIAVLARQYVKDNYKQFIDPNYTPNDDEEGMDYAKVRNMVNQIMMSSAIIALDKDGNPYSPRKQGAGIADIVKATTTPCYIYTEKDGEEMTTTKLELGDDPEKKGVYTMTFFLRNISSKAQSYELGDLSMTESLTVDKKFVAEKAFMLDTGFTCSVKSGTGSLSGNVVTVQAGATAEITVELTLNGSDKEYINNSFPNGMYVEGFVTLTAKGEGVDLNVPYLAFFGDWAQAPIFDKDYYEVETTAHNNAIDDKDKIKADYYATTPLALYYYDYIIPMGTYLYDQNPDYDPIPATQEHSALSYWPNTLSGIYSVNAGLLRGAKQLDIEVRNSATGELVWSVTQYNCAKAHYNGQPMPYFAEMRLNMIETDEEGYILDVFGDNNAHYDVTLTAHLDWEGERNIADTYTFGFYIDYEAPTVVGSRFYTELNTDDEPEYYVELEIYDNHYAMSARPIILDYDYDEDGNINTTTTGQPMMTVGALSDDVVPVMQESRGGTTKVRIKITDYLDRIKGSLEPDYIMFQVDDYALNTGLVAIPFPEIDNTNLQFGSYSEGNFSALNELTVQPGQTKDILQYVVDGASENGSVNRDFLFLLDWESSNPSVATVNKGVVEGISQGETKISFTVGGQERSFTLKVEGEPYSDPNNRDRVYLEDIVLTGYTTNFAFSSDIDYSEIGSSGSKNYFEETPHLEMYPSERVTIDYKVYPENIAASRYKLTWRSNDPEIATVDQNGMLTAISEGTCAITLNIEVDGRPEAIEGRCEVTVKSPFIIDGTQLVAYKGMGDDYHGEDRGEIQTSGKDVVVTIPDDKGIMYISSFAFCHYNMDHSKVVDDEYDLDAKREPLGNNTITKVIIPDGITTIENYAFYNCMHLKEVVILSDSVTSIGISAFEKCSELVKINLEHINLVSTAAFRDCTKLTDLGEGQLSHVYAVGDYAFANCQALQEVNLANLREGGIGAFMNTKSLTNVTLGEITRISEQMFYNSGISSSTRRPLKIYSDIVPASAFAKCKALQGVEFVNDLTYIGDGAFADSGLQSVKFDGACDSFGLSPFSGCTITAFEFPGTVHVEQGVAYEDETKTKLLYATPSFTATSFTVPASVKEIAEGAFSGKNIATITFEQGSALTTIGNNAFYGCTNLRTVNFPSTVSYIGSNAFSNTAITALDLSATQVTSISDYAFESCRSLRSITLPAALTSIGEGAFARTNISSINLSGTQVAEIGVGAFFNCSSLSTVNLPATCTTLRDNAFEHCTRLTNINLENVTFVGDFAFYVTGLRSVNLIADGVQIGYGAFCGDLSSSAISTTSLTTIVLGDNAQINGDFAFAMSAASSLTLGENVHINGSYVFSYGMSFRTVDLHGAVGKLGDYAFAGCSALTEIDLGDIEELGEGAFFGCQRLATVHSPSLKTIGMGAFFPASTSSGSYISVPLRSIDLENVETIGDSAFARTSLSGRLSLPSLKYLGERVFQGTSVSTIVLSDSFVSAAPAAMSGATKFIAFTRGDETSCDAPNFVLDDGVLYVKTPNGGLNLVTYPVTRDDASYEVLEGTVRIENSAFLNNTHLTTVTLPGTLRTIGDYAFGGCTALQKVVFRGYYAPTLEGSLTANDEITPNNKNKYPNFDDLYKYDFYWLMESTIRLPDNLFSYSNFVDLVTKHAKIDMQIPTDSQGYDAMMYRVFFNEPTLGDGSLGKFALDFMDAVNALPNPVDRYASKQIEDVIAAYDAMVVNNQQNSVEQSYIDRYNQAVSDYRVDVARDAIVKLNMVEMDRSSASYNAVKAARDAFNALTSGEKQTLAGILGNINAQSVIDSQTQALKAALDWQGEIDFSKDYEVYGGRIRNILDQLEAAAEGLTPENLTEADFDKIYQIFDLLQRQLNSADREKAGKELTSRYQDLIDAWNNITGTSVSGALTAAESYADSVIGNLFTAVAAINMLLAAAVVVLKGGLL